MDAPISVAIITAAAAVVVPAISFSFTKRKERQDDWRRYKFEMYKEFVQSLSGIVGSDSTPEGNRRFAEACNTLHLIASKGVISTLHDFQEVIRVSNPARSPEAHDFLLSRLLWEIREDVRVLDNPSKSEFKARLWCSGAAPPDDHMSPHDPMSAAPKLTPPLPPDT
jgi:hypothetical protein